MVAAAVGSVVCVIASAHTPLWCWAIEAEMPVPAATPQGETLPLSNPKAMEVQAGVPVTGTQSCSPPFVQLAPQVPNRQARVVFAGRPEVGQTLPHAPQLDGLFCTFVQELGATAGQGCVAEAVLAAHIPFCAPVTALEQPMHIPAAASASGQAVVQQTPSTQNPLVHSMVLPHEPPAPLVGMQLDPEQ